MRSPAGHMHPIAAFTEDRIDKLFFGLLGNRIVRYYNLVSIMLLWIGNRIVTLYGNVATQHL